MEAITSQLSSVLSVYDTRSASFDSFSVPILQTFHQPQEQINHAFHFSSLQIILCFELVIYHFSSLQMHALTLSNHDCSKASHQLFQFMKANFQNDIVCSNSSLCLLFYSLNYSLFYFIRVLHLIFHLFYWLLS